MYCVMLECFFPSAYEDEDLRDIRASMERLLQEDQDFTRTSPEDGAGDLNGNPSENESQESFNRINAEVEQDSHQMAIEDDDDDEEEEEDEEGECSNGSPGEEEAGGLLTNGVGDENHSSDSPIDEEWQSGKTMLECSVRNYYFNFIFAKYA